MVLQKSRCKHPLWKCRFVSPSVGRWQLGALSTAHAASVQGCAPCPSRSPGGFALCPCSALCLLPRLIAPYLLPFTSHIFRVLLGCPWATVHLLSHSEATLKCVSLQIQMYLFILPLTYLKNRCSGICFCLNSHTWMSFCNQQRRLYEITWVPARLLLSCSVNPQWTSVTASISGQQVRIAPSLKSLVIKGGDQCRCKHKEWVIAVHNTNGNGRHLLSACCIKAFYMH